MPLAHKCQNLFDVWDLVKDSVELDECLTNEEEIARGAKITGAPDILKNSGYWFRAAFFKR